MAIVFVSFCNSSSTKDLAWQKIPSLFLSFSVYYFSSKFHVCDTLTVICIVHKFKYKDCENYVDRIIF